MQSGNSTGHTWSCRGRLTCHCFCCICVHSLSLAGQGRDVDHVMTTAELGKIFVERGIKLNELPESDFDCLCGEGTGGAVLFGTTGGVMEAALRTVYEVVSEPRFDGHLGEGGAVVY